MDDSAPTQCEGVLEPLRIDFDTDDKGQPFRTGDTPRRLPQGIRVKGWRKGSTRFQNHITLFNTSNPTGGDKDLRRKDEDLVLIIN